MWLERDSTAAFAPPPAPPLYFAEARQSVRRGRPSIAIEQQENSSTIEIITCGTQRLHRRRRLSDTINDIFKRIQSLGVDAEIENIPFSMASLDDFLDFIQETSHLLRPSLFLNDNGNLRAVWRNNANEQVGLQFLGAGGIEFVIFKQQPNSKAMTRVAGVDTKASILSRLNTSGALSIISV